MEASGGKKSILIRSCISPLFFHIVPNLVQALVITYEEIFQALAVQGDVLLPKPFLDFGHRRSFLTWALRLSRVRQTKIISEAGDFPLTTLSKLRSRNGFGSRTSPCNARAWKTSSYIIETA
jgi:hypothetical protein